MQAPVDLLLGTDLLPPLGFALIEKNTEGEDRSLMVAPETNMEGTTLCGTEPDERRAEVRLLQAVRIAARHQKLVRERIDQKTSVAPGMFEPTLPFANELGLSIAEALVEPDEMIASRWSWQTWTSTRPLWSKARSWALWYRQNCKRQSPVLCLEKPAQKRQPESLRKTTRRSNVGSGPANGLRRRSRRGDSSANQLGFWKPTPR